MQDCWRENTESPAKGLLMKPGFQMTSFSIGLVTPSAPGHLLLNKYQESVMCSTGRQHSYSLAWGQKRLLNYGILKGQ